MPYRQAVLFIIDTQGANCVGCYRPELPLRTPHLDGLAARGVRFDAAYTCSPVCGPARSALMTGLYPHGNGVLANDLAPGLNAPTLGQRLQRRGVATGHVGKWHLDGTDYFGDGRCPPGWDERYWFDGRNYLDSLDDAGRDLARRVLGPGDVAAHPIASEFTYAHRVADRSIDFLHTNRGRDFLLVVSIDEPHHPWICPEPFASAFTDFQFPVPNANDPLTAKPGSQREWAEHVAPEQRRMRVVGGRASLCHPSYFGCNGYSDAQVGRVLAAIDEWTPDALVVYTSDHGDMLGSHRLHGKGPCMYEEIARIPLIVRWRGKSAEGAACPAPVSHIDVVPTLLDFFGEGVPDLLNGRSLLPRFENPGSLRPAPVFIEFNRFEVDHDGFGAFAPIRCVVDAGHKLAVNLLDRDELYDLNADPLELRNRIDDADCAAIRTRLFGLLTDWMNRTRDPLRGPHWGRRGWNRGFTGSTWGGPTRPRPFDEAWYPKTLLYETGREIERYEYEKH